MGRRRALVALFGVVGLLTVAVVMAGNEDGPRTQVAVGSSPGTTGAGAATTVPLERSATTSTTSTSTTSTTSPTTTSARPPTVTTAAVVTTTAPPIVRRAIATIAASGGGTWTLFAVDEGEDTCVELVAPTGETKRALCNAAPAVGPLGEMASFPMGRDWAVVAVVGSSIDGLGFRTYSRSAPPVVDGVVGVDPRRPGHAFAATVLRNGTGIATRLFLVDDGDIIGRVSLPAGAVTVAPSQLDLSTEAPYGRWPGYRLGAFAGLLWGGYQEVGFYDGPSGVPCVLFRRFGTEERLLYDGCPAVTPGLSFAGLVSDGPDRDDRPRYQAVLVVDGPATAWRCDPTSCDPFLRNVLVADPNGTGRRVGVPFASVFGGAVDVVVLDGEQEVGRARLAYPTTP